MTKRERVLRTVTREPADRPPYAFWRHFPQVDRAPASLAQATLRFHERYGSDFLKVTPAGGYAVQDWGCVESDELRPDGSRPCARHAVNEPGDWQRIRPLQPGAPGWGSHLETVLRCVLDRRADCSVLPTVFSPLSLARKLSGDRLSNDLAEHAPVVVAALEAITETVLAFMDACFREGAEGVFYSIQAASTRYHTREEYDRFGLPYDHTILSAARPHSRLTIIHGHGDQLMFDRLATLPGDAWNWDDRRSGPPLEDGLAQVPGAVIGGLDQWTTLKTGTPETVRAQAQDAIARTGGRGLVVGPGCVVQLGTPDGNLIELATSLGGSVKLAGIKPEW